MWPICEPQLIKSSRNCPWVVRLYELAHCLLLYSRVQFYQHCSSWMLTWSRDILYVSEEVFLCPVKKGICGDTLLPKLWKRLLLSWTSTGRVGPHGLAWSCPFTPSSFSHLRNRTVAREATSGEIPCEATFRFSPLILLLSPSPYWFSSGAAHWEPSGWAAGNLDAADSAINDCRGTVFICSHAIWQWEIGVFLQKVNEVLYTSRWTGKFCWLNLKSEISLHFLDLAYKPTRHFLIVCRYDAKVVAVSGLCTLGQKKISVWCGLKMRCTNFKDKQ